MHKRAARVILELQQKQTRTETTCSHVSWIPFYIDVYINQCVLAYKRLNGILPGFINASLKTNSDAHSRNTKYCNLNLLCPCCRHTSVRGGTHPCGNENCERLELELSQTLRTKKSLKSFEADLLISVLNS